VSKANAADRSSGAKKKKIYNLTTPSLRNAVKYGKIFSAGLGRA
jgi:hypothetical protein